MRCERQDAEAIELLRRLTDEQSNLPVACVISESDRPSVLSAEATLRRKDQERFACRLGRIPAHACVLRQPEDVA